MRLLQVRRLAGPRVSTSWSRTDEPVITATFAANELELHVELDLDLNPRRLSLSDDPLTRFLEWPEDARRRFINREHLDAWLTGHCRYGAVAESATKRQIEQALDR